MIFFFSFYVEEGRERSMRVIISVDAFNSVDFSILFTDYAGKIRRR